MTIDPEVRKDFVEDGQIQAKQVFDHARPAPRSIDPIPVEGRDGVEPEAPRRPSQEYQAVHLLSESELKQASKTDTGSIDAQARALTQLGSDLVPELVQVCALMHLARATPTPETVDRLTHGLDALVQMAATLRNSLATHR